MLRILIIIFVIFLIPFFFYRILLNLIGKDKDGVNWLRAPLGFLSFIGVLMSIATIISLTLWSQGRLELSWLGL